MTNLAAFAVALAILQNAPLQNGKFDDSPSSDPRFKSVGIRGSIDAGGYAASAQAKTQTEFYEQLADLQMAVLNTCAYADSQRTAYAFLASGDFAAAVKSLESELPSNAGPGTRGLLGLAYEAIGQLAAASEQFRVVALAHPNDVNAASAYAIALLFEGDSHTAAEVHAAPPLCTGAALFEEGRVSESLDLFLKSAGERPSECTPFGFIATAVPSADPQTLNRTITSLLALLQNSPINGGIHYALACAKAAQDRTQTVEIESQLKQAVRLAPNLADAHFRLGAIYAERQEPLAAIAEYKTAVQYNPRLIESHYRLGQLYNRTGESERAKTELELYQRLRAQQKSAIESGRVPIHFSPCS